MKRGRKYKKEEVEGYADIQGYNIITYGEEILYSRIIVLNQVLGKEPPRNTSIIFVMVELNNFGNMYECIYSNEPITRFEKPIIDNQKKLWKK